MTSVAKRCKQKFNIAIFVLNLTLKNIMLSQVVAQNCILKRIHSSIFTWPGGVQHELVSSNSPKTVTRGMCCAFGAWVCFRPQGFNVSKILCQIIARTRIARRPKGMKERQDSFMDGCIKMNSTRVRMIWYRIMCTSDSRLKCVRGLYILSEWHAP